VTAALWLIAELLFIARKYMTAPPPKMSGPRRRRR
jgi:hypothetical protein